MNTKKYKKLLFYECHNESGLSCYSLTFQKTTIGYILSREEFFAVQLVDLTMKQFWDKLPHVGKMIAKLNRTL